MTIFSTQTLFSGWKWKNFCDIVRVCSCVLERERERESVCMGVWVDTSVRERKRAKANLSSNASYSSRKPATLASTAKEEKAVKKKE